MESPRCSLRPFAASDTDWLAGLLADQKISRFLWDCAESPGKARRYAEGLIELDQYRRFGHWAIEDKEPRVIHGWAERQASSLVGTRGRNCHRLRVTARILGPWFCH